MLVSFEDGLKVPAAAGAPWRPRCILLDCRGPRSGRGRAPARGAGTQPAATERRHALVRSSKF
jgi:hypothetical protein